MIMNKRIEVKIQIVNFWAMMPASLVDVTNILGTISSPSSRYKLVTIYKII